MWLAPVQAAVLPVSEKYNEYAAGVVRTLDESGVRVELDDSAEKIGAKIRRATMDKIPYMAVVGEREAGSGNVSVRHRTGGDRGAMPADQFRAGLQREIETKGKECPLAPDKDE